MNLNAVLFVSDVEYFVSREAILFILSYNKEKNKRVVGAEVNWGVIKML